MAEEANCDVSYFSFHKVGGKTTFGGIWMNASYFKIA
jgi:hypothetical protein